MLCCIINLIRLDVCLSCSPRPARYQVLAVASETKTKEESQNIKTGKRVAVSMTCCVKEVWWMTCGFEKTIHIDHN